MEAEAFFIKKENQKVGITKDELRLAKQNVKEELQRIKKEDDLKLFNEFIYEGVHDPAIFKVFFLAGGPGSGKSFVTGKVTPGAGLKIVNSDILFELLLKKARKSMSMLNLSPEQEKEIFHIRQKAKEITANQLKTFIDGRLGVVIDGTGKNYKKIRAERQKFIDLGYDTYLIFVNTSIDVALARNLQRARKVPIDIVKKSWGDVQHNLGRFQNLFGYNNFMLVDNNNPGDFPKKILDRVWKRVNSLVKKPLVNPIALAWVHSELDKKKSKKVGSDKPLGKIAATLEKYQELL